MCKPNESMLQQQKQQAPIFKEKQAEEQQKEQQLQARPLQAQQENRTRELETSAMVADALHQFRYLKPEETAPGTPVQTVAPPKLSFKEKQKEKKALKAAKRSYADATQATCHISEKIREADEGCRNSVNQEKNRELIKGSGVDAGVFSGFLQGHRTRKNGAPASPEDKEKLEADSKFIADYCSGEQKSRSACLDQMVEQLFSAPITVQDLNPTYVEEHAGELKRYHQMNAAFDLILKDTKNADYFEQMDPVRKQVLQQNRQLMRDMNSLLEQSVLQMGVQMQTGAYITETRQAEQARQEFTRLRSSISDQAQEHQYNTAQQVLKTLASPVLDYDVDALKQLSDAELAQRADELTELAKNIPLTLKMIEIPKPGSADGDIRNFSARQAGDQVLGQEQNHYRIKAAHIRAFAIRADELKRGVTGDDTQGLTELKRVDHLTDVTQPESAEFLGKVSRADKRTLLHGREETKGERMAKIATEKFYSGTPEMESIKNRIQKHPYSFLDYTAQEARKACGHPDLGEPLFRSFGTFCSMEATQALMDQSSFEKLVKDTGAGDGLSKENIQEAEAQYQALEQTIQSKEKTGEAVTEEERETCRKAGIEVEALRQAQQEAIQANKRGLDAMMTVLKAQYDMLARKYGNITKPMTIEDTVTHSLTVSRDFASLQVDLNLLDHMPSFLDMNDPENELLVKRIQYYSLAGFQACNLVPSAAQFAGQEGMTQEFLLSGVGAVVSTDFFKNAEAWLKEHDPAFNHDDIRWDQKVDTEKFKKPYQDDGPEG